VEHTITVTNIIKPNTINDHCNHKNKIKTKNTQHPRYKYITQQHDYLLTRHAPICVHMHTTFIWKHNGTHYNYTSLHTYDTKCIDTYTPYHLVHVLYTNATQISYNTHIAAKRNTITTLPLLYPTRSTTHNDVAI